MKAIARNLLCVSMVVSGISTVAADELDRLPPVSRGLAVKQIAADDISTTEEKTANPGLRAAYLVGGEDINTCCCSLKIDQQIEVLLAEN